MRRRDLIKIIAGSMAAWPLTTRAQKRSLPVIGFLSTVPPDVFAIRLRAFHQGLKEAGYVAGQNVAVEYHSSEGQSHRLPALAAELVQRQVAVIAAGGGTPAALAAKAATATIPIVFETAADPVELGLVASLNRPGGNITGVANLSVEVGPKKLELLRELIPTANDIAVLIDPTNPSISEHFLRGLQTAAPALGLQLHVLRASTERDLEAVFATFSELRAGALVIGPSLFFSSHTNRIAALALRHAVPTISQYRPFVEAGGLVSYGPNETDNYRLVGIYAARILKGEKPAELPVVQSAKVELFINLKTAKALGITVPLPLSGRADELIE